MPSIRTYNGGRVDFLDPKPEQFTITDIARGLSNTCRYSGQIPFHYSTGQHSVLMTRRARPEHKLATLLHDAPEAYLGDPVKELKPLLPDYAAIEKRFHLAICKRFDLDPVFPPEVKELDRLICADEIRALWSEDHPIKKTPGLDIGIVEWTPRETYAAFMREFAAIKRTLIAC